jgi:hypothetical protein
MMLTKNNFIIYSFLFLLTGCYVIPLNEYQRFPSAVISTNIKTKKELSNKYLRVGLTLGELGLGGYIDDLIFLKDTLLFIGVITDEVGETVSNVKLHPVQKRKSKITKKEYYEVLWDIEALTDADGNFSLKVPSNVMIHGMVRYRKGEPPNRLSAWLFSWD